MSSRQFSYNLLSKKTAERFERAKKSDFKSLKVLTGLSLFRFFMKLILNNIQ